jgi:hypothetical protein
VEGGGGGGGASARTLAHQDSILNAIGVIAAATGLLPQSSGSVLDRSVSPLESWLSTSPPSLESWREPSQAMRRGHGGRAVSSPADISAAYFPSEHVSNGRRLSVCAENGSESSVPVYPTGKLGNRLEGALVFTKPLQVREEWQERNRMREDVMRKATEWMSRTQRNLANDKVRCYLR